MRWGGFTILAGVLLLGAAFWGQAVLDRDGDRNPEPAPKGNDIFSAPQWQACAAVGDRAHLRWRSAPGALAYTVWRSIGQDGEFEFLWMGRDTTFTDSTPLSPDRPHCYRLTATDPEFDESAFSACKCVEFLN